MSVHPFTPGELEVMQVLWEHGELKPGDIQKHFPRPIRNAALRSALLVMLEKGHVARRRDGKAFYYKAKTAREGGLRRLASRLADAFAGGSAAGLIAQLIEQEKLSGEDIAALRQIVERKSSAARESRLKSRN